MKAWIIAACLLVASPALSDPCKAIPDRGPMPAFLRPGATFGGPVGAVLDADSICVTTTAGLVEVRIADFYGVELHEPGGQEAKAKTSRALLGREIICQAGRRSYDRVVASCTLQGRPLGRVLRDAGVAEGGRGK